MNKVLLIAALALAPILANAADAPAVAPTAGETVAPANCKQPDPPNRGGQYDNDASAISKKNNSQADFQTAYNAYTACMHAYIDSQAEMSKKHIAAANAAVKEVNDYNAKVSAAQQ